MRRLVLLLSLLITPLMWLGAEPALACSCVLSTVADFVDRADVVVNGRVRGREDEGREIVYTFFGSERYKGDVSPGFEVRTSDQGSMCGEVGLVVGRRYVVFMDERGAVNSCGGTAPATATFVEQVEAVTGPGFSFELPPPGPPEPPVASIARTLADVLSGTNLWA